MEDSKEYIKKIRERTGLSRREFCEKYGLSLKVCQSCKYFQPVVDGSTNMVQGCLHVTSVTERLWARMPKKPKKPAQN